jgi:hypothetical protein
MSSAPEHAFESSIRFEPERIHAAAIYCSDGRWGLHCDEFLHQSLKLPRYDRLAVPGGAACMAGHFDAVREGDAVVEQLRFLLKVHELERMVLIAHEGCAFYSTWLHISLNDLRARQQADLSRAAHLIRKLDRRLAIDAYYAYARERRVIFEQVDVQDPVNVVAGAHQHWVEQRD